MVTSKDWRTQPPPVGQLVLAHFGDFEGDALRRLDEQGNLYDGQGFRDNSGLVPQTWTEIPAYRDGT